MGTLPGKRERGRMKTSWADNITTWTVLTMDSILRMSYSREKWAAGTRKTQKKKKKNTVNSVKKNRKIYLSMYSYSVYTVAIVITFLF